MPPGRPRQRQDGRLSAIRRAPNFAQRVLVPSHARTERENSLVRAGSAESRASLTFALPPLALRNLSGRVTAPGLPRNRLAVPVSRARASTTCPRAPSSRRGETRVELRLQLFPPRPPRHAGPACAAGRALQGRVRARARERTNDAGPGRSRRRRRLPAPHALPAPSTWLAQQPPCHPTRTRPDPVPPLRVAATSPAAYRSLAAFASAARRSAALSRMNLKTSSRQRPPAGSAAPQR